MCRKTHPFPLHIHFYSPRKGEIPWWMRLWKPRFSHCTVEYGGFLLDAPYQGVCRLYPAVTHKIDREPDATLTVPLLGKGDATLQHARWADVAKKMVGNRVEKLRAAVEYLGQHNSERPPFVCTAPVLLALRRMRQYAICSAFTPDEVWDQILKIKGVEIWTAEAGKTGRPSAKN